MTAGSRTATWAAALLALAASDLSFAQGDLQGRWYPADGERPRREGDGMIGDYLGVPLNDAGRRFADSWSGLRVALPEFQCRAYPLPYMYSSLLAFRVWDEFDPITHLVENIRIYIASMEQERTIWMDGRRHPSPNARHTWMGFSTGYWRDNMLVVDTTHLKQGFYRLNGIPTSDRATVTERFVRHGDLLVHISILTDSQYYEEPAVRSRAFRWDDTLHGQSRWSWPCQVEPRAFVADGVIPHHFPGENPDLPADEGLLGEAARGGAHTLYPGFIE